MKIRYEFEISYLALIASFLAFFVVILGAYTRLTDAGLGCPDWPTCYNHLTVPQNAQAVQQANISYPGFPLNTTKAWTEMTHRYAASILGLFILGLAIWAIVNKIKHKKQHGLIPLVLVALVIFQALLGKWTVTLRLNPLVVMSHLLGGLSILGLLWLYFLQETNIFEQKKNLLTPRLCRYTGVGLIILILQIILGGWTSANYAALVCPDFPLCLSHQFLPQTHFKAAFNILNSATIHLDYTALVTIHMMHRLGAFITGIYLVALAIYFIRIKNNLIIKKLALGLLLILTVQISLGVMNVILYLPLFVAVLHNAIAAVLLLYMITINFYLFKQIKL